MSVLPAHILEAHLQTGQQLPEVVQDRGALAEALTARVQALPPLELSARVRVQNLLRFLDPLPPPLVRWLLQALESSDWTGPSAQQCFRLLCRQQRLREHSGLLLAWLDEAPSTPRASLIAASGPEVVQTLLASPRPKVRQGALPWLNLVAQPGTVALALLAQETDLAVRQAIWRQLWRHPAPHRPLLAAEEPDVRLRPDWLRAVARAFSVVRQPDWLPSFFLAALDSADLGVQVAAVEALRTIGHAVPRAWLVACAEDPDPHVRLRAALRGAPPGLLTDADPTVRLAALLSASEGDLIAQLPVLPAALSEEVEPRVRQAAAWRLALLVHYHRRQVGPRRHPLLSMFSAALQARRAVEPDPRIRWWLWCMGGGQTVPRIVRQQQSAFRYEQPLRVGELPWLCLNAEADPAVLRELAGGLLRESTAELRELGAAVLCLRLPQTPEVQALERAWVVGDPCWKVRRLPTYRQPR